jgi:ferric-dicitrate binding protein FerR (iron transport regulator)
VSLVEGSVLLNTKQGELKLKPGTQGIINSENLLQQDFDARKTLSWMKGIYYFEEAPLTEIVKTIPRWYKVKVVIDNSRNSKKRFVGVLNKNQPLEKFLENLRLVSDIRSDFDKDGVLHFK